MHHKNRDDYGVLGHGLRVGNRGHSRHRWWAGPREPPQSRLGFNTSGLVSLFVDGISRDTTLGEVRRLFETIGTVADVYLSGKHKKNMKVGFGFVRFFNGEEAAKAIKVLDGRVLHGHKLRVSLAKYQKNVQNNDSRSAKEQMGKRNNDLRVERLISNRNNALRDHRSYSDALLGSPNGQQPEENGDAVSSNEQMNGLECIKLIESQKMKERLNLAVVLECENFDSIQQAGLAVEKTDVPYECMSSLSPSKLIVFFDNEMNLYSALEDASPLRAMFTVVRKWSEDECYLERIVWLECVGLNPLCYSHENLMSIGDKWGKTLKVDNVFNGVDSLTSAKLMVRTTIQQKIEEEVKVVWHNGSCVVWIREMSKCECKYIQCEPSMSKKRDSDISNHEDDNGDGQVAMAGATLERRNAVGSLQNELGVFVDENTLINPQFVALEHRVYENTIDNAVSKEVCEEVDGCNRLVEEIAVSEVRCLNQRAHGNDTDAGVRMQNQVAHVCENNATGTLTEPDYDHQFSQPGANFDDPFINVLSRNLGDSDSMPFDVDGFDPMVEVELNNVSCVRSLVEHSVARQKPRGRPKRVTSSLPNPLYVPSTPSNSVTEAQETWRTAKSVGVKAKNEDKIITELRKSKRILAMVGNNPVVG